MKRTAGENVFNVFNLIVITVLGMLCLLPMLNVLAISFSSSFAVNRNEVTLIPVGFNLRAYRFLLESTRLWRACFITFQRVVLGTAINMALIVTCAYPLSKPNIKFRFRTVYAWYFAFTILFSGGLIPLFILILNLGLLDNRRALILPGALPVFNMLLMLNFFRAIPVSLEEAAIIDGASHFRVLTHIYLPCSLPAIATITLFCIVGHWNSWFDGIIYSNRLESYPLQSYLQTIIVGLNLMHNEMDLDRQLLLGELDSRNIRCAQIIIAIIPIACVYPWLQKYFVSGIVLGSVKE